MPKSFASVREYLDSLPDDRRAALEEIRKVFKKNLDGSIREGIQYGMIGYFLPHSEYPWGYHCDPTQPLPFASLASQKGHIGLYLFCIYTTPQQREDFAREWKATGKRLDMGASCVRVKKLEDIPMDVLAKTLRSISVKSFIEAYEASLEQSSTGRRELKRRAAKISKKSTARTKRKAATAATPPPKPAKKKKTTSKTGKKKAARAGKKKKKKQAAQGSVKKRKVASKTSAQAKKKKTSRKRATSGSR